MPSDGNHDQSHRRPHGCTAADVEAAGAMSEALERIERARGALYEAHQLIGGADGMLDKVITALNAAGRSALASSLQASLVGADVLAGRWTYDIVEEFDTGYYAAWREWENAVRAATVDGRRHVYEAEMRLQRQGTDQDCHEPSGSESRRGEPSVRR
jgi:hypothetical protein